jgi:hypothetical protein
MAKGLDYTVQTTPELAKAFVSEGIAFVCRYLVPERYSWKRLTKQEAKVISEAGLNIVSVFESTANRPKSGAEAGKADGITALAEAKIVGQPQGSAIYFAVDYDAQPIDYPAIEAYLKAAQAQIPGYHVGVYASHNVCLAMFNRGITHLWQTYAWSKGKLTTHANVYQHKNGQKVAGITADLNNSYGGEGWWSTRVEVEKPLFSDVAKGTWYEDAIAEAVKDGYLAGYPDGTFKPNEPLTRAQGAVLYVRQKRMEKGGETK